MTVPKWWLKIWSYFAPARKITLIEADETPDVLQKRDLYVATEDGVTWEAAMKCPCGCGEKIELQLIREAKPHWRLKVARDGKPTLHPSVFRTSGCRSHFWLKNGRINWAE